MAVKVLLGKKVGMTSIFNDAGGLVPVTVIQAGPCTVVQRRTLGKDGYSAIQLGYGEIKRRKLTKPMLGHFQKKGVEPKLHLQEFRIPDDAELGVGAELTVEVFKVGDKVNVTGTSKGKGFQGAMKRWGFGGQRDSHGAKYHRRPASQGAQGPQHVFKGTKSPGRMGGETVTVKNLTVVGVDAEHNLLLVKGSVPGANGGLLRIEGR